MQNKNIKNKISFIIYKKGFTLVETLVALLILSLVFVSVISLMSSSIFSARYAKNEIKATYIAQEGIDYIRNLRDSIGFLQNDWNTFYSSIDTDCGHIDGCMINRPFLVGHFSNPSFIPVPVTPVSNLEFRNVINTECINVFAVCDELHITSTVYWKNGNVIKSRSLEATLTQWN